MNYFFLMKRSISIDCIHLSPGTPKALKVMNELHITVSIFFNLLIIQSMLRGISETQQSDSIDTPKHFI